MVKFPNLNRILARPVGAPLPEWLLILPLLVILAAQLAVWTWVFARPRPPAPPPSEARPALLDITPILQSAMFGHARQFAGVASNLSLQLLGVYAGSPGYALVQVNGKPQALRVGDTLAPDVTLAAVDSDHVTLRRHGDLQRLGFPIQGHADASAAMPATSTPASAQAVAPASHLVLSRADLQRSLRDPGQWLKAGQLVRDASGGLRVVAVKPGGLYQRLGLQSGDVVESINGQSLNSPAQALGAAQTALSSGHLSVQLQRMGSAQTLNYQIR